MQPFVVSPGVNMEKELYCYPCNLPFKNRGEHLKFIGKETWSGLKLPESDQIEEIVEIEPNVSDEDEHIGA